MGKKKKKEVENCVKRRQKPFATLLRICGCLPCFKMLLGHLTLTILFPSTVSGASSSGNPIPIFYL